MEMFETFEIVEPYPALYVEKIDAVVISDLHLGLESLMARAGTLMPKIQLSETVEDLEDILERKSPRRIVICGDLKHEFSETSYGEREEVQEFMDFLTERVEEILLVKGNHDNYLIYPVKEYENVELQESFILEGICFLHGHEVPEDFDEMEFEYLVIGHEHPALALKDEVGIKEKLPCFLFGDMNDGRRVVVLPAFSNLAEGSQVNVVDERELNSSLLRQKTDFQDLKSIGIDREAGTFEFAEVGRIS